MRKNLEPSLKLMFGDEGGYSNRKTDKGGPTKYGITHKTLAQHRGVRSVTAEQVKAMGIDEARDIYITSYWGPSGGDVLPDGLDYEAFDFGVNSGPMTAVKQLQRTVGAVEDGWIGVDTLKRVKEYKGGITKLIKDYGAQRMTYLRSLKDPKTGFPVNGRGWTIRVTGVDPEGKYASKPGVIGNALAMAKDKPIEVTKEPSVVGGDSKSTPQEPNPWTKPDVLIPIGTAVAGGGGTILSAGVDPVRIAFGFAIIVATALTAYLVFRRIGKQPAA